MPSRYGPDAWVSDHFNNPELRACSEVGFDSQKQDAEVLGCKEEAGTEAVSGWLFRRVGVDLHVRNHYVLVGRIPVIVLALFALGVIAGAVWLVLKTVQVFQG